MTGFVDVGDEKGGFPVALEDPARHYPELRLAFGEATQVGQGAAVVRKGEEQVLGTGPVDLLETPRDVLRRVGGEGIGGARLALRVLSRVIETGPAAGVRGPCHQSKDVEDPVLV